MGTVELRSMGPGRKGIPLIREIISDPISYFPIYIYIGYKGISVYGKNQASPIKSLGVKFHCSCCWHFFTMGLLENALNYQVDCLHRDKPMTSSHDYLMSIRIRKFFFHFMIPRLLGWGPLFFSDIFLVFISMILGIPGILRKLIILESCSNVFK